MLSNPSLLGNDPHAHGGGGGSADDNNDGMSYFNVVDPGLSTGCNMIGSVRWMGRENARLAIGRARSALVG
jgi:hypothetical protein